MECPDRDHGMKRPALLAIMLLLGACGGAGGDGPARTAVPVTLGSIRRDSIVLMVEADGRLISRPNGAVLLSAPADAVVKEVRTHLGARVAAGSVVLELDAPDLVAQAAALRAQATAATADADRQRQLLAEGIAARRDVDERAATAEGLQAQAAAAEALLRRATVRSPLAGIVSQLLVREGSRVTAGDALVEVVDPAQVYAAATVPAASLAGIRPGQRAYLHLEGGSADWPAEIESVGATVDSLSNTALVLVRPRGSDPMLRPGLGITVRVQTGVHRDVLVAPGSALVFVGNTPTLFVVGADSIARARSVVVVARSGELVEVTGAVAAGDRVVTVGAYGLPDSAHVVPQEIPAP